MSVPCFFSVNQVYGEINMVPGTPVRVCAKCINPDHPVPYLAVILWSQDSAFVNPGLVDNLMSQPADQILGSLYLESAEQLLLQVQQPVIPIPKVASERMIDC